MAPKSNAIVGLDIGTTTTSIVVAEIRANGEPEVTGLGHTPSKGLRKGVVINIESTIESIAEAIQQAETMAGCEISSAFASISGSHLKGFNSHGIVAIKGREVTSHDVERVIEAARAVAIPVDREILHVLPQEFIVDDQDGVRDPIGMSGVRLEAKVHIVTGAIASAQNVVKCANRCGLSVRDIVIAGLASGKAVLSAEEQELGVCVVDIGGGTTDIAVYEGGAVKHSAVISLGGNHISNDIAAGLRTPLAAAERIKCEYGTATSTRVRVDETLEVPSTGGRPPRVLSKSVLAEIIEPRVTEIFTMVQRELIRSESDRFLTGGLVICGGSANLKGVAEVAEKVFQLPVRIGVPAGVKGLSELVSRPEYATCAGLIHYGASAGSQWYQRGARDRVRGFMRRAVGWLGEHF